MATQTIADTGESITTGPSKSVGGATTVWCLLALVACSHFAIALKYFPRLWSQGHYQYFPLVLGVIAWLFWSRRSEIANAKTVPSPKVIVGLLAADLVAVLLATLLNSSAVGMVSFALALITAIYWCVGSGGLRASVPMLSLLVFVTPLPLDMDQHLIMKMQFLASHLASLLLDSVGAIHFRNGVILTTENNQFLTEEACSGIRSLFSSMAAIAIYGVVNRYPLWRHLMNLVQVLFWVIIGNALRVATVIIVTDNWTDRIASGTGHEILGLLVFLFIFAMAMSTDRLLTVILRLIFPAWQDPQSMEDRYESTTDNHVPSSLLNPTPLLNSYAFGAFFVLFTGASLLSANASYARFWVDQENQTVELDRLSVPKQEHLPSQLGDWQLSKFEHTYRGEDAIQAQDSYIWTYNRGDLVALVSIDCPWSDWHNLDWCYSALGWETQPNFLVSSDEHGDQGGRVHTELTMTQDHMHGMVIFSSVDRQGEEVLPPLSYRSQTMSGFLKQVMGNMASALTFDHAAQSEIRGVSLPASTLQLFAPSGRELTEQDRKELRELFFAFRQKVLASPRYQTPQ
ncbi:exosortase U [Rhodopirellula sp. SWK7]|uniref:exosortase U n=1 Tax=Rhodopirellula sp. SWK7 TaxID=595460 RepID=UPI0002BDA52F|nr:exosortase U [Rhodopirellula sp. SWK7]EMI42495.1 membrane protein containing Exosortase, EpsH, 8 transmembrane domain protein [Rhodopirellula sp. SWK7]